MSPAQPGDAPYDEAADAHPKLLLVTLQESVVALAAEAVLEILPSGPYATVPGADAAVAGIVNRRGRMLTVVDLGAALGQGAVSTDPGHRVVVVAWRQREIGLAVREVLQITTAWWNDDPADPAAMDEMDAGEPELVRDEGGPDADQQLQVIELDSVLAPLFGGFEGAADATGTEKP